jgi:hypothetical protein
MPHSRFITATKGLSISGTLNGSGFVNLGVTLQRQQ